MDLLLGAHADRSERPRSRLFQRRARARRARAEHRRCAALVNVDSAAPAALPHEWRDRSQLADGQRDSCRARNHAARRQRDTARPIAEPGLSSWRLLALSLTRRTRGAEQSRGAVAI